MTMELPFPATRRPTVVAVGFGQYGASSKSRSYSNEICIQLSLNNIQCIDLEARRSPYHEHSFRKVMQARTNCIQNADVYCPIIDLSSFLHEQSLLELYYALRSAILNHHPLVVPILDKELMLVSSALLDRERGVTHSLSSDLEDYVKLVDRIPYASSTILQTIPWLCQTCSMMSTDCSPADVATKLLNFCQEVGIASKEPCSLRTVAEMYEDQFRSLAASKRPNTAVMRMLRPITSKPAVLTMQKLILANALMGTVGCCALSQVLRLLPALHTIDLQGNGIECAGIRSLCQNLATHPSVVTLNLDDNLIATAGLSDLYFLALDNGRITTMTVEQNLFTESVWIRRIQQVLTRNGRPSVDREAVKSASDLEEVTLNISLSRNAALVSAAILSAQEPLHLDSEELDRSGTIRQAAERFVSEFLPCNQLSISRVDGSAIKIVVDSDVCREWMQVFGSTINDLPHPGFLTVTCLVLTALSKRDEPVGKRLQTFIREKRRVICKSRISSQIDSTQAVDFSNRSRFVEATAAISFGDSVTCTGSSLVQVYREQIDKCCGSFSKELEVLLGRLHSQSEQPAIDSVLAKQVSRENELQEESATAAQQLVFAKWGR